MGRVIVKTTPVLPAEIRCGAMRFKIAMDPEISRAGLRGQIDIEAGEITIEPDLPLRSMAGTLMHEMVHGVFWANGDYKHFKNETLVTKTSNTLLDMLVNSPGLLEYLISIRDA